MELMDFDVQQMWDRSGMSKIYSNLGGEFLENDLAFKIRLYAHS